MRHMQTQVLLNYWRRTRGEQSAPQKSEIEPRDIKTHLAFSFLLKREASDRFTFALAGTGLCDLFGRELRGQSFVHLWAEQSRDAATISVVRVTNLSVPTVALCVAETADQRPLSGELLLLPYASERGETNWVFGHFQSLEPLSRLHGRKLVRMRMGASAILTGDAHGPNDVDFVNVKKSTSHLRVVSART
ncbi:MAG: PAS domain-containing protein [Micropepsaceae bacterium]